MLAVLTACGGSSQSAVDWGNMDYVEVLCADHPDSAGCNSKSASLNSISRGSKGKR